MVYDLCGENARLVNLVLWPYHRRRFADFAVFELDYLLGAGVCLMNRSACGIASLLLLLQVAVLSERCQGATVNFEQATDLDRFSKRNQFQWFPGQWQATGGIGNSGSITRLG